MDLDLTDDQRLLRDLLDRVVADEGGLEQHRAAICSDLGWSCTRWRMLAELGLLALFVGADDGGLGGGGTELVLVGEAFGRGLIVEPYLENAVVAAPLIARAGETAGHALAALIDGSHSHALIKEGVAVSNGRLSGSVKMVPGGDSARALLVHVDGEGLFLLTAEADGVTRSGYPLHGGGRAADIGFDSAAAVRILDADAAAAAIAEADARRTVYLVAEALGIAAFALDRTVEHLKTRVQFGQPIGANQSLQHRAAEMYVELEQLRSAVILAACMLNDADPRERRRVLAAVSMVAAKAGRFIAQQAVQLHGGVGVTADHAVGHCFLRLTAIGLRLGGAEANATLLARLGGFVAEAPYWEGGR